MKKIIICLIILCGILFTATAYAVEDKKSIVVFPLNTYVNSSSYAMYSGTQNMFAADLVNSLQEYKDLDVIDIATGQKMLSIAGLDNEYQKLIKEYKTKYTLDYEKIDMLAQALGANYIVFIHGGFDVERSFFKPNKAHQWQWIWASPIKPSAQLNINVTLIDADKHSYPLEENVQKDIPMENFKEASNAFAENMVPISNIKEFSKPNAAKIAQKIHNVVYPIMKKDNKFAQKNAFIEKFVPNNGVFDNTNYHENVTPQYNNTNQISPDDYVNNARRENYKNWVEQQL